ncbi:hypothetical protein AB0M58_26690 [Streptomyces bobili]|uniref:hypothetical protein n=1 Tax=Streptomyces bobili TaxID=67280 RepID=UPI003435C198
MPQRRLSTLKVLFAALLIPAVAACTQEHTGAAKKPSSSAPTSVSSTTESANPNPNGLSASVPPELDDGETLAARHGNLRGNHQLHFAKGKKGDALIVAVRCQGKGELNVEIKNLHSSFPLECIDKEVSETYNLLNVKGAEAEGDIFVRTSPTVRWSLTVGRGTPPEEEEPSLTSPAAG